MVLQSSKAVILERSTSQIYRKQMALWRGVHGPQRCLLAAPPKPEFGTKSSPEGTAELRPGRSPGLVSRLKSPEGTAETLSTLPQSRHPERSARRSIAKRGPYRAESKDPGEACWQLFLGAFRPQTTPEDKRVTDSERSDAILG
jgi:hypothetical protein